MDRLSGRRFTGASVVKGRILHLSSAHPWTDTRIHLREAAELAKAGFDVGLLAVGNDLAMPPTGVRIGTFERSSRIRRVTFGTVLAVRSAIVSGAEIVHIHDPELIWTIPLLRALRRKVIYDAHEDLPSQMFDKAYLPNILRPIMTAVAHGLVRVAGVSDHVIAATETVSKRFPAAKTTVVRNYPTVEGGPWTDPNTREPYAVYVGSMSAGRGTRNMIDALSNDHMPAGWTLQLAGGASDELLEGLKESTGWDRVEYHGLVTPLRGRQLMKAGRVGLVVLGDTPAYRDALPTKMFEYMAAGMPVIASDFPLWRQIVEQYECGLLVQPDDPDGLASALMFYSQNPEVLRRHSINGYNATQATLNWSAEFMNIKNVYNSLMRDA